VFHEEGQGKAVVLLHSSMSSRNQWRALAEQLRSRYRVITIDLLGYGDSRMRRRDTNYRLADEARHVESVLANALLPCETFHLVGHSYGGVVALSLAQRAPQRLDSLTLYEPLAVHLLPPRDPARLEFELLGERVGHDAAADNATAGAARFIDHWSGQGSFSALPPLKQRAFTALLPKVLMEFRAVSGERRITSWLRDFDVPVCLMHGNSSPSSARRVIAFLAALLPRIRRIEFGAGHMGPVTHPDMVNPEIARFISSSASEDEHTVAAMPEFPSHAPRGAGGLAKAFAIGLAALLCAGPATRGLAGEENQAVEIPVPANAWRELPQDFSNAGRYAVVSGDPRAPGGFIVRIELPPGFELSPRRAERDLQLVVLSGEMTVSRGATAHPAGATNLKSGYFAAFGAGETYSVTTKQGVALQVFGTGPWKG